ncbi:hypothetical protein B4N84_04725 [Flavobacterium sp. IR1]|nr:hypothetical protein B4N84_04725 [Flavobacterium sp. IR1]
MFKKLLFTSLFLINLISYAQNSVLVTPLELKNNRNVFQTVNAEKKEVTLFISDKEKIKALQLNENFQIKDSISELRPDKKYTEIIGYNIKNDNTRLYWSSNDRKKILSQLYDFESHKTSTTEHELALNKEKVVQEFSSKDNFYILTILKNSNIFNLHIFDKEGRYMVKSIDLSSFHFFRYGYTKTNLSGVFEENLLPFENSYSLQNINADTPASLANTAKKRKCYFTNNQIIITLDKNVDYTQVIIIDLENYTAQEKIVQKHTIPADDRSFQNSNSFFFNDKLLQIKSSSNLLYFTIKDLDNNIIKEYTANATTPIDFKNSQIYQEGGDFGGKRILEKSSQFIRKVNNLHSGISCYYIGENMLVTLGGISETHQTTGQLILASQFGLIGGLLATTVFNPTMQSFNSYENKKVVKIEGLFDKEGNHVEGELAPLAFDKIRTIFDNYKDVSSQTIFKVENTYYLGYYDNQTKNYIIRSFID